MEENFVYKKIAEKRIELLPLDYETTALPLSYSAFLSMPNNHRLSYEKPDSFRLISTLFSTL